MGRGAAQVHDADYATGPGGTTTSITDNGGAAGGQRGGWGRMARIEDRQWNSLLPISGRTVASQGARGSKQTLSVLVLSNHFNFQEIYLSQNYRLCNARDWLERQDTTVASATDCQTQSERATVGSKAAPEASVERAVARPRRKAAAPATTRQLRPRAGAPRSPSMDSSASRPPRTPAAGRSRSATPFPAHDLDPDADALFGDIDGDKEDNEEEMDLERIGDRRGAVTSPERGRYKPDRLQILDSDDSEPEDDYEETEKRKERDRRQKVSPATTIEDEDKEDEVEFDQQEEADALSTQYHGLIKELAAKHGNSSQTIERYLGTILKPHREKSAWNHYQGYFRAADGGAREKPADMEPSEWTGVVSAEYHKALRDAGIDPESKPTTEQVLDALPHLKKWVADNRSAVIDYRIDSGVFAGDVNKVAGMLTKMCTLAYDELGVHAFGYIVDPVGGESRSFGGSEATTTLKLQGGLDQKKLIKTYEHKLGIIQAQLEKDGSLADGEEGPSPPSHWVSDTWNRDKGRAFIKDCLVEDQVKIEIERGDLDAIEEGAVKYQMSWTWSDHAFQKQLRIENWPTAMAADGRYPKQSFQQTSFGNSDLKAIIPAMEKARGNAKYEDDKVDAAKALRIVEWTEAEKLLPLEEQGDVVLVKAIDGQALVKVSDSKKFVVKCRKTGRGRGAKGTAKPPKIKERPRSSSVVKRGAKRDRSSDGFSTPSAKDTAPSSPIQPSPKRPRHEPPPSRHTYSPPPFAARARPFAALPPSFPPSFPPDRQAPFGRPGSRTAPYDAAYPERGRAGPSNLPPGRYGGYDDEQQGRSYDDDLRYRGGYNDYEYGQDRRLGTAAQLGRPRPHYGYDSNGYHEPGYGRAAPYAREYEYHGAGALAVIYTQKVVELARVTVQQLYQPNFPNSPYYSVFEGGPLPARSHHLVITIPRSFPPPPPPPPPPPHRKSTHHGGGRLSRFPIRLRPPDPAPPADPALPAHPAPLRSMLYA
ncbi:hypothetical protein DFH06DRAFT_1343552 [Mycena polygramma]|nr:hypothetical protein DFH06DRAFT_1343552 [Mycena polygramma]